MEKQIAKTIYELSESNIYQILEKFEENKGIDKSLVYCFVKAFYLHSAKLYIQNKDFDKIYSTYKEILKTYFQTNNPTIEAQLLDQVLNFFDNSYSLINTAEFDKVNDSYEFRHYTINMFELLKMILEKKSNSRINENIFDDYIKIILQEIEEIPRKIKGLK